MNNDQNLLNFTMHVCKLSEEVYKELGAGFKEDTLQQALAISFRQNKIKYLRETHLEIFYKKQSLGFLRLDFLIPPQRHKKWILTQPLIIETKAIAKINNDSRLQLKNYLISLPRNTSEELKNIKSGLLINWKNNLEPTDNSQGVEVELFTYKRKKFSFLYSNVSRE